MPEVLLQFITPGPLTLPTRFRARVLTSWISSGWVLGLVLYLYMLASGEMSRAGIDPLQALVSCGIGLPFALCFYGLLGLAVDSGRGNTPFYPGWYWYLYPLLTACCIAFSIIIFGLALAGVKFPKHRLNVNKGVKLGDIRSQIRDQRSDEILDQAGKILEKRQQQERVRLQKERFEEKDKQELINSLSIRDRILMKLKENPAESLEEILTEEELEELAEMLIEALLDS
jgi:hypothetical protein